MNHNGMDKHTTLVPTIKLPPLSPIILTAVIGTILISIKRLRYGLTSQSNMLVSSWLLAFDACHKAVYETLMYESNPWE